MRKPFLYALSAVLYIVILVLIVNSTASMIPKETIVIPMTMLSLFVLSVAVMGFLFLSEPLQLLIEKKKQEAVIFFAKTVGFFACFVAILAILILII